MPAVNWPGKYGNFYKNKSSFKRKLSFLIVFILFCFGLFFGWLVGGFLWFYFLNFYFFYVPRTGNATYRLKIIIKPVSG